MPVDPHVVAEIFKMYLKEGPPMATFEIYDSLVSIYSAIAAGSGTTSVLC